MNTALATFIAVVLTMAIVMVAAIALVSKPPTVERWKIWSISVIVVLGVWAAKGVADGTGAIDSVTSAVTLVLRAVPVLLRSL